MNHERNGQYVRTSVRRMYIGHTDFWRDGSVYLGVGVLTDMHGSAVTWVACCHMGCVLSHGLCGVIWVVCFQMGYVVSHGFSAVTRVLRCHIGCMLPCTCIACCHMGHVLSHGSCAVVWVVCCHKVMFQFL